MLFILFTWRHVISLSTLHGRALCIGHVRVLPRYSRTHTHTRTHTSTLPLVFVNIKPQNNYLNMNCACLYVNEWSRHTVLFSTCTKDYRIPKMKVLKRLCLYWHVLLNEDINTWTALRVASLAFDRLIWVELSSSYHIHTQKYKGIHGNPSK